MVSDRHHSHGSTLKAALDLAIPLHAISVLGQALHNSHLNSLQLISVRLQI